MKEMKSMTFEKIFQKTKFDWNKETRNNILMLPKKGLNKMNTIDKQNNKNINMIIKLKELLHKKSSERMSDTKRNTMRNMNQRFNCRRETVDCLYFKCKI